jgi:drug/metabolite transporter (DMT)-like permease
MGGHYYEVHAEGLAAALLASVLFNVGIVLQALDARVVPRSLGLRFALLARLLRRPIWLTGLFLGLLGALPQAVAYNRAPFVLVQPVLALGLLLVLVLGARILHERVGLREILGTVAIIGGVTLVAWGAPPHSEVHRGPVAVLAVFAALSAAGLAPFAVRGSRFDTGMLVIIATGCAFGATNVATKLVGDNLDLRHLPNAGAWAVAALVMGVAATIVNMTAFQRRAATTVVPVSTAVQTFLPIVLEPFFLHEHWSSAALDGLPLAAGLGLALAGVLLVAGSTEVSELVAAAATDGSVTQEPEAADRDQPDADDRDERGGKGREPRVDPAAEAEEPGTRALAREHAQP